MTFSTGKPNAHLAGGLRLKPGDGPVQVTLELTVKRV